MISLGVLQVFVLIPRAIVVTLGELWRWTRRKIQPQFDRHGKLSLLWLIPLGLIAGYGLGLFVAIGVLLVAINRAWNWVFHGHA